MPDKYLNENLYWWLKDVTGYYSYDLEQMSDVGTYVNIARYHGIKLKFDVDDEHFKWTQVSSD